MVNPGLPSDLFEPSPLMRVAVSVDESLGLLSLSRPLGAEDLREA